MPLDEQIAQYTNAQEFARLCNSVLTATFPGDFQAIDGTRADAGNDGYLRSERRIYAFYCPAKPVRRSDADYVEKARNDFVKALKIKESGQLAVESWAFVTPEKLSHAVVVAIEKDVSSKGLKFFHVEATYLAGQLLKHPHLIRDFPGLHISQLEEVFREALNHEPQVEVQGPGPPKTEPRPVPGLFTDHKNQRRIQELAAGILSQDAKAELRAMVYGSVDPAVQVNAVIALCNGWAPADDSADDLTSLCEFAANLAHHIGSTTVEGFLWGMVGNLQSFKHSLLDLQVWASDRMDAAIGMNLSDQSERQRKVAAMQQMKEKYKMAFSRAFDVTKEDPAGHAGVLIHLGNAAGQRAGYIRNLGDLDGAANELATCKNVFLRAKTIYSAMGDRREVCSTMLNLANQVRFHGEEREAEALAEQVLAEAEKVGDAVMTQKAKWLLHTLKTGEIPDYQRGERRVIDSQ